jgi:hypothetical protein
MDEALNAKWSALANDFGQLGLAILDGPPVGIGPKGFGEKQPLGIMLMSRTLLNFKGVFTLIEADLVVEARVLVRCCYENAFWVAGIVTDGDDFIRRMLHEDMRGRQALGELVLSKKPVFEGDAGDRLKDHLRAIKKQNPDANGLNPKGVANDGPLADLYMVYSQLSADAVHPTITSLNRHTVRGNDPGERIIDVVPAVNEDEVLTTIDWACDAMLVVCVGVNQILGGTEAGQSLGAFADRHRALREETDRAKKNQERLGSWELR